MSEMICATHMYTCNTSPRDVLKIQVTHRSGAGQDSHTSELSNKLKNVISASAEGVVP